MSPRPGSPRTTQYLPARTSAPILRNSFATRIGSIRKHSVFIAPRTARPELHAEALRAARALASGTLPCAACPLTQCCANSQQHWVTQSRTTQGSRHKVHPEADWRRRPVFIFHRIVDHPKSILLLFTVCHGRHHGRRCGKYCGV